MAKIETTFIRPKEEFNVDTGKAKVVYDGYQNNPHEIELKENLESDVEGVINDTFKENDNNNVAFTDNEENEHELITSEGFGDALNEALPAALANAQVIKTTWSELKALRDGGELIAGSLYRITDYNCTTTQENTQSAGHQFDIVLLALSNNKLAEEGWAMMNESNIYDVTFTDGVTKKCYAYFYTSDGDNYANVVDCVTMLGTGTSYEEGEIEINEQNKTMTYPNESSALITENLTYNYFQNSNLSAWKVWYCLDNDKSRFAWADDSVDEDSPASINFDRDEDTVTLLRRQENDELISNIQYYAWGSNFNLYTLSATPQVNDTLYEIVINASLGIKDMIDSGRVVKSFTPAKEGTGLPNGRGVIYRLIDEWNIDYPCDFKNMQMLIPMDGEDNIDMENPVRYKYCYAFTDNTSGEPEDLSIKGHAFNIKVKANLVVEDSTIYISPRTLFYKKREELIFHFSDITVGIANNAIFINHGRAINILDGSNNIILITCVNISIGNNSYNVMLNAVSGSTFGSNCKNIQLANVGGLNYGNNGVELATKDDLE